MPWIGFVFLMGHMSVNHIARQMANSPRSVDVTGAQMVLVIKLSAFCWNVADGVLPEAELSDFQKDRRLTELPGLLDFAGYVFFFPGLMVGPAFDFAEYRRWLDTSMFDVPAAVEPAKKPPTRRRRRIPRSGTPAVLKLLGGLAWIFAFVRLSAYFPHDVLLGDRYPEYGFLRRLLVLHMVGFTARAKYYGVWILAEGACILAGLGYNGVDPATGKVSWDRLRHISPWGVETAQNTRAYLEAWNINTNKWLRNYVYLRVTPRGKKPGFRASLATFTTSAFWHGFYPGYYLTFVLASFIQTVAKSTVPPPLLLPFLSSFRSSFFFYSSPSSTNHHPATRHKKRKKPDCRRHFRPFFLDPRTGAPLPAKRYYDVASWLTTQLTFSFAVAPFLILSLRGSLLAWARVHFYAVVGTAALMAFFASPAAKKHLRARLERRAVAAAAGAGAGGEKKTKDSKKEPAVMMSRSTSSESLSREPVMGISQDPGKELDEAMSELRAGVEATRHNKSD